MHNVYGGFFINIFTAVSQAEDRTVHNYSIHDLIYITSTIIFNTLTSESITPDVNEDNVNDSEINNAVGGNVQQQQAAKASAPIPTPAFDEVIEVEGKCY